MAHSNKQRHTAITWEADGSPREILEANMPRRVIKRIARHNNPKGLKVTTYKGSYRRNA